MNKDKIANAIEKDAGQSIPELREALAEMENGSVGRVTTCEQSTIVAARNATGLSQSQFAKYVNTPVRTL